MTEVKIAPMKATSNSKMPSGRDTKTVITKVKDPILNHMGGLSLLFVIEIAVKYGLAGY